MKHTTSGAAPLLLALLSCTPAPSPDPGPPPAEATLSLAEATAGLGSGALYFDLHVGTATITARLDEARAPKAVANFVGLARGLRFFQDVKTGAWVKRPFYKGLRIHRGAPEFLIQGGCPRGDGRGGPGYSFTASPGPKRRHDRAGVVSMVRDGDGRFGAQWLITDGPQPQLDGEELAFGQLTRGRAAVSAIARRLKLGEEVTIRSISVYRAGGSDHGK